MRIYHYLILIGFTVFFSCQEEEASLPAEFDITISKTLFNQDEIKLFDFIVAADKSIVLAYNGIDSLDFSDDRIIDSTYIKLQKMDEYGQRIWTKAYHIEQPNKVYDIIQSLDGGYILTGTVDAKLTFGDEKFILLIKTDSEGQLIWKKELERGINGQGYVLAEKSNGDIVLVGKVDFEELIELDQEGNIIKRTAIPIEHRNFPYNNSMCLGNDETIVVCGNGMKAYKNEVSIWNFTYQSGESDYKRRLFSSCPIAAAQGGGYMGFGYRINNLEEQPFNHIDYLLTRVDEAGNILWEKLFDNSDQDWGYDINPTDDGNFVAIGKSVITGSAPGGFIRAYKFDADGNTLWQHRLDATTNYDFVEPSSIRQFDKNHVVVLYSEMKINEPQIITEINLAKIRME